MAAGVRTDGPDWDLVYHLLAVRSGGRCEISGVRLDRTNSSIHHRRPRAMGGTSRGDVHDLCNLILAEGHGTIGAHMWVEVNREAATERGLLVPQNHDPAQVPVTLWSGRRVMLDRTAPLYLPPADGITWSVQSRT